MAAVLVRTRNARRLLSLAHSVGALALISASTSLVPNLARAQSFVITSGTTSTTQRTLSGTQTGQIDANGALQVAGGNAAIVINNASTAVAISNAGTVEQTGTARAIDVTGGAGTTRGFVITNGASGIIRTAQNDAIRLNIAATGSTITIDNSGLIRAGGTGFAGLGQALDFRAVTATSGNTATIINRVGGIIESLTDDAIRPGQAFVIQNSGTIRSFGANTSGGANGTSDGIDAGARTGITVTNNSGGLISGARHGVTADSDITVVNNAGATIIGRNGSGVGSDGNGTVTNYGTITGAYAGAGNIFNSDGTASLNGDGDGVDIDLIGTVRNFGTIQGTGAGGVDSGGRPNGSDGIAMGGGTIENNAGALISGANRGILIDDGAFGSAVAAIAITNAGTIQGLSGTGIGIVGNFNNSINNSGTISGTGTEAAIFINGNGANTIVNSGTISTSGTAQAIFFNGNGNNALTNSGTIATSGSGVALQFGNGNNSVTTSGSIRAASAAGTAIQFGSGNNTLIIQGGEIIGNVTAGAGTNSVTFVLGSAGAFTIGSAFSGFSTATVQSGKLTVNGSLAAGGGLTIAPGASIGGTGTFPSLVVNGTISPGNSVGTLTVNGSLTLGAGATTVIEISGSSADRINVGGSAVLDGALQLVAAGGPYAFGMPYTILTATGGRSGAFATVSTSGSFGVGVTSAVAYGANDVSVTLTPAPLVVTPSTTPAASATTSATAAAAPVLGLGQTRNITAVALGLDRAVAAGADVSSLFGVYNQPTREALANAVNTLSGEVHTAASAIGYQASDQFLRAMLNPSVAGRGGELLGHAGPAAFTADLAGGKGAVAAPAPMRVEPGFTVWGAAFGEIGRTRGDAGIGSAVREVKDANIAVGADYRIAPASVVGFALSGGQSRATLGRGLGSAEADLFQAGLYGATRLGALALAASASYGSMQVETKRLIPALGLGARAEYRADVLGGRVQAAYELFDLGGFALSPLAALQIQSVRTPSFREVNSFTGLAAGVSGDSRTNTALRSELGVRIAGQTELAGRKVKLFSELSWGHSYLRENSFAASITGIANSNFLIEGARTDRNAALLAAGLDVQLAPNVVLGGRIDASASANSRSYAGSAALRVSF